MTRSERERQIERYISGGMNPAEEQDFFIQAALDKELRIELKALMTVDSAIRKEREAEPGEHTALRARVASMLASAPAPQEPAPPSALPQTAAPAAGTVAASAIQKILPIQWISLAAATIALTAVLLMMIDRAPVQPSPDMNGSRQERSGENAPATREHAPVLPAAPEADAAPAPAMDAAGKTGVPSSNRATPQRNDAAQTAPTPEYRERVASPSESRTEKSADEAHSRSALRDGSQDGTADARKLKEQEDREVPHEEEEGIGGPTRRGGDSLSVGVNIRLNKKK